MVYVTVVCEAAADEAVARRIVTLANAEVSSVHVTNGKAKLDASLKGYNAAAQRSPWLVIRDLNSEAPCRSRGAAASQAGARQPCPAFSAAGREDGHGADR